MLTYRLQVEMLTCKMGLNTHLPNTDGDDHLQIKYVRVQYKLLTCKMSLNAQHFNAHLKE